MARDKLAEARLEGMGYALRAIKKNGLDAFEKELKMRGYRGITLPITQKEIMDVSEVMREMCLDMCLIMSVAALHDEFDFGKKRIERFAEKYQEAMHNVANDLAYWEDYIDGIQEQIGIKFDIRHM